MKTQDRPDTKPEENQNEGAAAENGNGNGSKRKPWLLPLGIIVGIIVLIFGVRYYLFARSHASTDDAYVTSDLIQISPQVGGTVTKVTVRENDHVKKGQILAEVDSSTYRQAVDQAQAALDLAISQEKGAETAASLTQQQGSAGIAAARGVIQQSTAAQGSARADVGRAAAAVSAARSAASGANAGITTAQAALASARAQVTRNQAAVTAAEAAVRQATAGVGTAQAALASATANNNKAQQDLARGQVLFSQGAIAAQQYDVWRTAAETAAAQQQSAESGVASAKSAVDQANSNLASNRAALRSAQEAVTQAQAQVSAARSGYASALDQVRQLQQQQVEAVQNVGKASGGITQAQGQLQQAETAPTQYQVSRNQVLQAKAKVEQARAALKMAQINLADCVITAPADGRVTHKSVEEGNLVQQGAPLMTLVPDEVMWILANFKETQLSGVKAGNPAEIDVDAIPGHTFTGHVESISPGTGSTFALLPPDNATGNFTKVVQRVTVKIVLDPNQQDLNLLRSGMSVTATIDLSK